MYLLEFNFFFEHFFFVLTSFSLFRHVMNRTSWALPACAEVCLSSVLIAYGCLGQYCHTVELVGTCTEYALGRVTGLFLQIFSLINLPYWIYLYCST